MATTCLSESPVTDHEESTEQQLLQSDFFEESDIIVMNERAKESKTKASSSSSSSSSALTKRKRSKRPAGQGRKRQPSRNDRRRDSPTPLSKQQDDADKNTRQKSISRGRDALISLNMNLDALAKSGAANRAEELLHRINALHEEGYYDVKPDTVSWNSVMNGYAQRGRVDQVQRIFEQIGTRDVANRKTSLDHATNQTNTTTTAKEEKRKGQHIKPSVVSFNTLIRAFARSGEEGSAERAEEVIRQMEQLYFRGQADLGPNTISFNTALDAISKTPGAAQRAEDLLRHMMQLCHQEGIVACKPDTQSFNTVLHAHALAGTPERAEELLKHMEFLYEAGNEDVQPDVYSYSTVMNAWASAAEERQRTTRGPRSNMRSTYKTKPNGDLAAKKCLALLKNMEEKASISKSQKDDTTTDRKPKVVKPNAVTYTSCIKALRYSSNPKSASVAHGLLRRMEKLYEEGDVTMKPDATCFTSVIDCYSIALKSTHHGEEAFALEACRRVQDILGRMNELYDTSGDPTVRPTVMTYGAVITTWARSGLPDAVLSVRELMEEMESKREIRPNTVICNALIDTIARSNDMNKAQKALAVLRGMERESENGSVMVQPDTISYNSVLQAAATSYGNPNLRRNIFLVAQEVFDTIHRGGDKDGATRTGSCPNSVTYFLYLKAIRKLVLWGGGDEEKSSYLLRQVFQWCCQDGLVSAQVLDQLQAACASEREMLDILQSCGDFDKKRINNRNKTSRGGRVQWQDLPLQWRRKAKRKM